MCCVYYGHYKESALHKVKLTDLTVFGLYRNCHVICIVPVLTLLILSLLSPLLLAFLAKSKASVTLLSVSKACTYKIMVHKSPSMKLRQNLLGIAVLLKFESFLWASSQNFNFRILRDSIRTCFSQATGTKE